MNRNSQSVRDLLSAFAAGQLKKARNTLHKSPNVVLNASVSSSTRVFYPDISASVPKHLVKMYTPDARDPYLGISDYQDATFSHPEKRNAVLPL
jgi:hypothetical protein